MWAERAEQDLEFSKFQTMKDDAEFAELMQLRIFEEDPPPRRKPVVRAKKTVTKKKPQGLQPAVANSLGVGSTCYICLEDMVVGDKRSVLKCKHVYHHKCLSKWLPVKKTCPTCRSKATIIN